MLVAVVTRYFLETPFVWIEARRRAAQLVHADEAGSAVVVHAIAPAIERWTLHTTSSTADMTVLDATPRRFACTSERSVDSALRFIWTISDESVDHHDLLDGTKVRHDFGAGRPGGFVFVADPDRPHDLDGGWLIGFVHHRDAATAALVSAPGREQVFAVAAAMLMLLAAPLFLDARSYFLVFGVDVLIAILFACSLHFLMGPGGMHSFGHAAYFGLGAYAAALCSKALGWPMWAALVASPVGGLLGAILFGWFCVRLSGVYLAMLTLAFSQIVWSIVYQWDALTGGSNGIVGVWPSSVFASKAIYYCLTLLLCGGAALLLWRILFAPFGYALRAARDSALRSEAIGLDVRKIQWAAFSVAGAFCGLAGGLFAFSKGSISPETLGVGRSVDGLVMVLLGGVETISGPVAGAAVFLFLQDQIARHVEYWRAILGLFILALVLLFPAGIVGTLRNWARR